MKISKTGVGYQFDISVVGSIVSCLTFGVTIMFFWQSEEDIENCLCAHYQVGSVEELGRGPVGHFSQQVGKAIPRLESQQKNHCVTHVTALNEASR